MSGVIMLGRLFRLGRAPSVLLVVHRAVTAVWLTACAAQLVIWLLIWIIGGNLLGPFWLWTTGLGAVVVAALWWATEVESRRHGRAR